MIDELKSSVLLKGRRGRPTVEIRALADANVADPTFVESLVDKLSEAEINPLFALKEGRGALWLATASSLRAIDEATLK